MAGKREEAKFREEVKKFTDEEAGVELKNLRGKQFTLRSQAVTEKVENFGQFGITKRNIARILTEQNARRIAKAAPAASSAKAAK